MERPRRGLRPMRWRRPGLDHNVRIGATEPEGADASEEPGLAGHGVRLVAISIGMPPKSIARLQCREVQMRWNGSVLQREHRLDQPGDSRGSLEMSDVRLDRTEDQRTIRTIAPEPNAATQCASLDRIAQRRACAVRFDVADVRRATPARSRASR